jgi:hypothetical protein
VASIHIREIRSSIAAEGASEEAGDFFEIRFDEPGWVDGVVDEDMVDEVIVAQSAQGTVTIVFDSFGALRSLDTS